jgi:PAS domain S-box-containing protein
MEYRQKVDILLVDDLPEGRMTLEAVLRCPEYNLVAVGSGEAAIQALPSHDFAAILLDVQMPLLDGFETAELIKQQQRFAHIPIIFVTAIHQDHFHIRRGYDTGAMDYISKPYDPYVLKSKVGVLADLHRKSRLIRELEKEKHALELSELTGRLEDRTTQARRVEDALWGTEELNRKIFESSSDCIKILNLDGTLRFINPAGRKLMGNCAPESILETNWLAFWEGSTRDLAEKAFAEAKQGRTGRFYGTGPTLSGGSRWWDVQITPITDPKGNVTRVLVVSRDTTEQKQAEEALRKTAETLARSNQEMEQFAYVSSHDLKEPLRMISVYVQMIEKNYHHLLDRPALECFSHIQEGAQRMYHLINDLLAYAGVGKEEMDFHPFDSRVAMTHAVRDLELAIQESNAEILCEDLPRIHGSEVLLSQLFLNLIGNAIKFRAATPPLVKIAAKEGSDEWTFSVRDNGIGLNLKYKEKIFVIFQRLHGRQAYPGTGVGLAICKKIVERHGGRIWVDSQEGSGSTFFFTLPKIGQPKNLVRAD